MRHSLDGNKKLQEELFGYIKGQNSQSSQIIFYNAELLTNGHSNIRDSVKLENKVGVKGAKFDMEIIETGEEFITYLEIEHDKMNISGSLEKMLSMVSCGVLRFGSKTSRGFGRMDIVSLKKAEFDADDSAELNKWLDFDVYNENDWEEYPEYKLGSVESDYTVIKLMLKQQGAISIREYSTDVSQNGETMPDYKHMSLNDGTSVIPGTSWAGAFRDRFREFLGEEASDNLFGYVRENETDDVCKKSRIIFSESVIHDNLMKTVTRNSIDRFSSATKDTALYTERTCYNGNTELEILLSNDINDEERMAMGAVITDLDNGFLSVGGLTAIGRGMFSVAKMTVNGTDKTSLLKDKNVFELLEV